MLSYHVGIPASGCATPEIFLACHWLKVVRVDAPAIPASMIQIKVLVDWTNEDLVCISMCVHILDLTSTGVESVLSIPSSLADSGPPFPARATCIDLRPEA